MSQLWHALEQIWGLSTSRLCWQLRLGDEEIGQHDLLVATQQLANTLPVAGKPYEWLEVSEFEDGVFEGYNEKTEEYVPVDRRDLVCYDFSVVRLGKVLSDLIGFGANVENLFVEEDGDRGANRIITKQKKKELQRKRRA